MGVLLTFLVIWNYSRSTSRGITTTLAALLKITGIALLAVCLLQPMRRDQRPRPRANLLPVLVDTSQSMDISLGQSEQSWRDRINTQFAATSSVLASLSESFDTRLYGFDQRLSSATEIGQLRRDGQSSRLSANLEELSTRLKDRPVAGVVLVSDGNESGVVGENQSWAGFPFPVYPVVPEEQTMPSDLRITGTAIQQTNFEISPVTVTVRYGITGLMGGDAVAMITDTKTGTVVAEQKLELDGSGNGGSVAFRFRPEDVGLRFYRVDLFREADRDAFAKPDDLINATSTEATLVNNTRLIAVDRRTGPYRVLYVSGRPNWDFKFLRRAVNADAEIELTGLIRMANKEPKFVFGDRGVSSANPLFQGLGDDTEEIAEQYDEPVMIRIGVKESEELSSGFPKTEDELFEFDALILDDIEPEFFSQDQLGMIRRFVSSRGGGMLMLGGTEMFAGRQFSDSTLGELSPVYMSRKQQQAAGEYSVGLTREGMLQPWLRLRGSATDETKRLRSMPKFTNVNSVGELKPGAFQLATVSQVGGPGKDGEAATAVAVHRFGKGKVGAFTLTDTWRWSMRRDKSNPDDPAQAWRQMVRWLVGEVPSRASISANEDLSGGDSVRIRVDAMDDSYMPMDDSIVTGTVTGPDGKSIQLSGKPKGDVPGAFEFEYYGSTAGEYQVTAEVRSRDGELVGLPITGWTRQIAGREYDELTVNRKRLQEIADQTGGQLVLEERLADFSQRLQATKVPVMETWVYPLWHRGWVIALALGCLCGEWGLRRWGGLA